MGVHEGDNSEVAGVVCGSSQGDFGEADSTHLLGVEENGRK